MNILERFNQGRIPSSRMKRDGLDAYALIHFGLNTFTDQEWGYGDADPALFNPSAMDAEQIVRACRGGGLKGVILVCKHHDGFCLWPTKTTDYNITKSPFRGGKGDLVREFSDACRKYGLAMGFYVSPWDRNSAVYGTDAYLKLYREQLREIYTNYGPAFEAWFDGANGGDGFYGGARCTRKIDNLTYYDWEHTWAIVRELQPGAAIFSDAGPDLRWVGNEKGFADEESFGSFTPHPVREDRPAGLGNVRTRENPAGHADGIYYIPPECDVPLRPGWFFHERENDHLRSARLLLKIYLNSVGCGGFLSLGLAPDKRGILHENDVQRLKEFRQAVDSLFSDRIAGSMLSLSGREGTLEFGSTRPFNLIRMREDLSVGEQITEYTLEYRRNGEWKAILSGKAVGRNRIKVFETKEGDAIRIRITASVPVKNLGLEVFHADEQLLDAAVSEADPRERKDYCTLGKGIVKGNTLTFRFQAPMPVKGFVFTPDPEIPAGTPDRYCFEADGIRIAEGEFSNLLANPIPQVVEFPERRILELRLTAERYLEEGETLALSEFGVLLS